MQRANFSNAFFFLILFLASDWIPSNPLQLPSAPLAARCVFSCRSHSLMHILRLADESPDTGGRGDGACPLARVAENQYRLLFRSTAEMPVYLQDF